MKTVEETLSKNQAITMKDIDFLLLRGVSLGEISQRINLPLEVIQEAYEMRNEVLGI